VCHCHNYSSAPDCSTSVAVEFGATAFANFVNAFIFSYSITLAFTIYTFVIQVCFPFRKLLTQSNYQLRRWKRETAYLRKTKILCMILLLFVNLLRLVYYLVDPVQTVGKIPLGINMILDVLPIFCLGACFLLVQS
jgi:hypothetical protein